MSEITKQQQDKLLSDAILLLRNEPALLRYLLALPRKYSLDELQSKIGHKCHDIEFGDYLLDPAENDIPPDDIADIMKASEDEVNKDLDSTLFDFAMDTR